MANIRNFGTVRCKALVVLTAFVIALWPSLTLAGGLGVFPARVRIDNLRPGEAATFELTVRNHDEIAHVFVFTTFQPLKEQTAEGRAALPVDSWISFSPLKLGVPANSEANVTVRVAIPREQKWAGQDWEVWLGIASESSDLLVPKLYVRLLVSTGAAVEGGPNPQLAAGIILGAILVAYGGYYYFKGKTKPQ
ncbi:MAG: hypothetical protein ACUVTR_07360 [Dehalococcoidia bacterium]